MVSFGRTDHEDPYNLGYCRCGEALNNNLECIRCTGEARLTQADDERKRRQEERDIIDDRAEELGREAYREGKTREERDDDAMGESREHGE